MKEFIKGDKVTCLINGEGYIHSIDSCKSIVTVKFFKESNCIQYNSGGHYIVSTVSFKRLLYHGHNLKVDVQKKEPVRSKWVNIYHSCEGKVFDSEQEAIDNIDRDGSYAKTIEISGKSQPGTKKFLLFAGHRCYPAGGFDDFYGSFNTIDDAVEWFEKNYYKISNGGYIDNWGHTVDRDTFKITNTFSQKGVGGSFNIPGIMTTI